MFEPPLKFKPRVKFFKFGLWFNIVQNTARFTVYKLLFLLFQQFLLDLSKCIYPIQILVRSRKKLEYLEKKKIMIAIFTLKDPSFWIPFTISFTSSLLREKPFNYSSWSLVYGPWSNGPQFSVLGP